MENEPGRVRHRLLLAVAAAALVGIGGVIGIAANGGSGNTKTKTVTTAAVAPETAPVDPHIAAGGHDFETFACARCHGEHGKGGVSPAVPALTTVATSLQPAELRSIIDHGLGVASNPTQPYMPVWGAVISDTQVNDLIAYLRAGLPVVPTAQPPVVPTKQGSAVKGGVLYTSYGCINCHGPNGLGGVPNPQSPDKTVPPLSGQTFKKEFNTDQKIIDVIKSGSVIGKAPIVSMPHWGGIIPPDQLQALADYIKTLK
ncbi:MAG: c-type cytochrome [Thermoleophilaceae bacterium]